MEETRNTHKSFIKKAQVNRPPRIPRQWSESNVRLDLTLLGVKCSPYWLCNTSITVNFISSNTSTTVQLPVTAAQNQQRRWCSV